MARSIEEIQADIARVKARMALKEQNQYRQPQSRAGWGSYIISGDRGMLDAYQNRENAWNTMMEQQMFQAKQNAENRKLQERLAKENRKAEADKTLNNAAKAQLDADIAQAEYDDAISKVDKDKPETVTAAKKAALRLNYANSQLPYFDKSVHVVPTEFEEDAPNIAKGKKIAYAKSILDPILKLDAKNWTNEQKAQYDEQKAIIDELAPELSKNYEVELKNKGGTKEDKDIAEFKELDKKVKAGNNMTARQRKRYNELKAKYNK